MPGIELNSLNTLVHVRPSHTVSQFVHCSTLERTFPLDYEMNGSQRLLDNK